MNHISQKEWDEAKAKGILEKTDTKGVNDWKKTFIISSPYDAKYGSLMYSTSLKRLRKETFNEFYGNGIVD